MPEIWKNVIYFSSIVVITEVLFQIKEYFERRRAKSLGKPDETATALFFPDFALCCPFLIRDDYHTKPLSFEPQNRSCVHSDCKFRHFDTDKRMASSFKKLCRFLSSAEKSLDICLWVFSIQPLANLCVHLHSEKKIAIRVVIDSREDETEGTKISFLKDNGIAVRYAPQLANNAMFHHKFAIVDKSLLLMGSMNWTLSGVRKNMENICVTSRKQLVSPYVKRFESYWETFSAEPTNKRPVVLITNKNSVNK